MKRIGGKGQSLYSYKGYTVDGYDPDGVGLDWRILDSDGEWILSLARKKDCKEWIDNEG